MNTTHKLLASSNSQAGIIEMIGKFWFSKSIELSETKAGEWTVSNSGKTIEGFRVVLKKGRFRFEGVL